jgi:hypothetical protein
MAQTAACVDIYQLDNGTLQDAFQFGKAGDTSWSLTGMSFKMEVKQSREDAVPVLTLTSAAGSIIVDDAVQRVLHLNVPDNVLQSNLPPAEYAYDLIMLDGSTPPIRTPLMQGKLFIKRGVTED